MKIVIRGIVKNTSVWVDISEVEALETATFDQVEEVAEQIREIIKTSFRDKSSAYITIGGTVVNISEFAILSVKVEK